MQKATITPTSDPTSMDLAVDQMQKLTPATGVVIEIADTDEDVKMLKLMAGFIACGIVNQMLKEFRNFI